jgi:hypothetical protein
MTNCKLFGRKKLWHNFKVLFRHSHGETKENDEKPQNSRSPGRDLNQELIEYEAEVLTTQPQRSVKQKVKRWLF